MDKFYIGQLDGTGLREDLKPYAIPDNAFASLRNAYVFRGRVTKRRGSILLEGSTTPDAGAEQLQSRLRINIGTLTSGTGYNINTLLSYSGNIAAIGQMFSMGDIMLTSYQTTGALYTTDGTVTGTYDTTSGAVTFMGTLPSDFYFYPALPVMGLLNYETLNVNFETLIAFDTVFSYQYSTTGFERIAGSNSVWTGNNSNFFWGANWEGLDGSSNIVTALFVTNYNSPTVGGTLNNSDRLRYYDGSVWRQLDAQFDSTTMSQNYIVTARLCLVFKDRLILLNTVENTGASPGTNAFCVNRCRYSWNGNPANSTAFYQNVPGKGGYVDAPTKEAIISAQFLKDRLIVYFERSTWELVYTNNQVLPFVWQKINTELGAEATFSQVPFDDVVLGVGNVGVHACSGTQVARIDSYIPDEVFNVHLEDQGVNRVYGIRDYDKECVYWSFPNDLASTDFPYPNRVLVYNYKTGSWAFNDDSITCFGYYDNQYNTGLTWAQAKRTWAQSHVTWRNAQAEGRAQEVIAGNQQGWVFLVTDETSNSPALQVTDVNVSTLTITCYNHNLSDESWIKIENTVGITDLDGIWQINVDITQPNSFTLVAKSTVPTGTYQGGSTIRRITPIDILTKQFNFYANSDRNAAINKMNFFLTRTAGGQFNLDWYNNATEFSSVTDGDELSVYSSNYIVSTGLTTSSSEQQQQRLWRMAYPFGNGQSIQFRFYLNDDSITADMDDYMFELHAFIVYARPTSSALR